MIVGVPREVKSDEYRVGMRPVGAELLARNGHRVLVEAGAGLGSGFSDDDYRAAEATIVGSAAEVWGAADLIVKVKEPQAKEWPHMRAGQVVFTYFHFAADRDLTLACLERKIVSVAYETLEQPGPRGRMTLPLLTPMSEIAGKMATQEGAKYLERPQRGRGVLLGGVPGVEPGRVLVLGGGVVGTCAAKIAAGMGADTVIMDIDADRMRYLDDVMPRNVTCVYSEPHAIREYLSWADLVIGAVLIPGAKAPHLVRAADLKRMKEGAVIVDVSIDQGGCVETSKVTTHGSPTYIIDGVVHYCVGNMPGAVARTSTKALTNATMPWVIRLADAGYAALAERDPGFRAAINTDGGRLVNLPVAEAHGLKLAG
ncbi:MAG TPA: alanine dehydrogenase [Phycisphaerales bacterium]|nr:alanine dehydrogenase [Phycisphaerales bacterium]